MNQVKEIQLTQREWFDATRVPPPHRDKTKQYRKEKHKKTWISEEQFVYLPYNKIIKVMLKKIDFKFLVIALSALSLGLLTMVGFVQSYIHFADPLNEMAFAFMAVFMGIVCLFGIKK